MLASVAAGCRKVVTMVAGGSPSSAEASTPAPPAAPPDRRARLPWPTHWEGVPYGEITEAQYEFPCIGEDCAADGFTRHAPGTLCRAYRDNVRTFDNASFK